MPIPSYRKVLLFFSPFMPRPTRTVSFLTTTLSAIITFAYYLLLQTILAVQALSRTPDYYYYYDYYYYSIEPSMSLRPLQATSSTNIIITGNMDDQSSSISRSSNSSASTSNDNITTSTGASLSSSAAATPTRSGSVGNIMQSPNTLDVGRRGSPTIPVHKLKNLLAALNFDGPPPPASPPQVVNENRRTVRSKRTTSKKQQQQQQEPLKKSSLIDSMMKHHQGKAIAQEAKPKTTINTTEEENLSAAVKEQLREEEKQQQSPRHIRHRVLHGTVDLDEDVEIVVYFDAHQEESFSNSDDSMDEHHQTKNIPYHAESIVLDNILLTRGGSSDNNSGVPYTDQELDQLGLLDDNDGCVGGDGSEEEASSFAQQQQSATQQNPTSSPTTSPTTTAAATAAFAGKKKKNIPKPPPPPPQELPLRFLRAGKGDPEEGIRRYKASLSWRKSNGIDTIMRQPEYTFDFIQQHYPAFIHGRGNNGEPCYYEQPPKTNLKALRDSGVTLDNLLHHYAMITEYLWQHVERDDLARSIYIIDLHGIRFGDFVGEVVDFVKKASEISSQHYPERAGFVFVIHVPAWFKLIWTVVKPWIDPVTLDKIKILRGDDEVKRVMQERIPYDQLPRNYGGAESSPALGESPEMIHLSKWIAHNNEMAKNNGECPNNGSHCPFCEWTPARSY